MSVTVTYFAQAARLIGHDTEHFEATDLMTLLKAVHERNGSHVENLICTSDGKPVPWILIDVDGELIRDRNPELPAGAHETDLRPNAAGVQQRW